MNRSQAVAAGVWYNPTPEQRRELKLRAEAFRSKQRRRVQMTLRNVMRDELSAVRRMLEAPRFIFPAWQMIAQMKAGEQQMRSLADDLRAQGYSQFQDEWIAPNTSARYSK